MKKYSYILLIVGILLIVSGIIIYKYFDKQNELNKFINDGNVYVLTENNSYFSFFRVKKNNESLHIEIKSVKYLLNNNALEKKYYTISLPLIVKNMKLYTDENKVQLEIINENSLNIMINDDNYRALSGKYELFTNQDLYFSPFTSDNSFDGVYTSEGSSITILKEEDKYFINGYIQENIFNKEELNILNSTSFTNKDNNIYFEINNHNLVVINARIEDDAVITTGGNLNETLNNISQTKYTDLITELDNLDIKENGFFEY